MKKTLKAKAVRRPSGSLVGVRTLQRKCACGKGAGFTGECDKCSSGRLLQRHGDGAAASAVPPVVHEVLGSSGQPLDLSTRAFMESRFGHDFGHVRIHTDARAAESAASVSALAYTVGRDVVFASGQYSPTTTAGRQLIAHELTHVVQQSMEETNSSRELTLGAPHDEHEQDAERAASSFITGDSVRLAEGRARLQRQPAPGTPSKTPAKTAKKTLPVENCPFPSDFKDANEAGLNMMCVAQEAFNKAPSCNLTDKHFELINAAKETARKRVEKANSRMAWLGGPEYAQRIAGKVFTGTPPDAKTIKDTLGNMVKILAGSSLRFNGATCADPLCESERQHAAAYESGPTEPVTFCPRSFLPNYLSELPRTIIHEAVHLSGIDIDPNVQEVYCMRYGCDQPCQSVASADAWALFIDCIGGPLIKPKTDKPAQP